MIKKTILLVAFAILNLTPYCSNYIHNHPPKEETVKSHSCYEAELHLNKDLSQERALGIQEFLTSCYLDLAEQEISAIKQAHDKKLVSGFSSIDEHCRRAGHHLTDLIEKSPNPGKLSDLAETYQFVCYASLE